MFLQHAQAWMTTAFPVASTLLPIVFNVLKGLLLIYLGIAIVRAFLSKTTPGSSNKA